VNEDVEQQANSAVATAEQLEERVERVEANLGLADGTVSASEVARQSTNNGKYLEGRTDVDRAVDDIVSDTDRERFQAENRAAVESDSGRETALETASAGTPAADQDEIDRSLQKEEASGADDDGGSSGLLGTIRSKLP
jgi:hypothetical protein